MATMIDGESYLGKVLVRPLDKSGDVSIYLWPVRCLKSKMGGPTFGVDVKGEEIFWRLANFLLLFKSVKNVVFFSF